MSPSMITTDMLRSARTLSGLTTRQLAKAVNADPTVIMRLEQDPTQRQTTAVNVWNYLTSTYGIALDAEGNVAMNRG